MSNVTQTFEVNYFPGPTVFSRQKARLEITDASIRLYAADDSGDIFNAPFKDFKKVTGVIQNVTFRLNGRSYRIDSNAKMQLIRRQLGSYGSLGLRYKDYTSWFFVYASIVFGLLFVGLALLEFR